MFDFKTDYIISNDLVEIAPLDISHTESLFMEANNKNIWQYFTENGYGKDNFDVYIQSAIQKREKQQQYPLVIKDLRSNELAGMTRIYEVDNTLKNVKIGHTWIGERFQGTGLNKNAKYLLFEFFFDKMEMCRIGFGASAENKKSIRAMESVGCKKEGVLRSFLPIDHSKKRIDIVLLSILKEEWDNEVKEKLQLKIKDYI